MATTPAPNLIPYPVGTDRVMDGDNAMQAIAERVTTRLGGWTAYVPVLANATSGNMQAQYLRTSDLITVRFWGAMATVTGLFSISLPVAADPTYITLTSAPIGAAQGFRTGQRGWFGFMVMGSNNVAHIIDPPTGSFWGAAVPSTWAAGDPWSGQFSYRPSVAN